MRPRPPARLRAMPNPHSVNGSLNGRRFPALYFAAAGLPRSASGGGVTSASVVASMM